MLLKDGKQVGGIGPANDPARGSSWSVYFATEDAHASTDRVADSGGTVVAPPMDVMGQGRMAVFQDPTGAYFNVWQPGQHAGAELTESPGSVSWVELMSSDVGAVCGRRNSLLSLRRLRDVLELAKRALARDPERLMAHCLRRTIRRCRVPPIAMHLFSRRC